MKIIYLLVIVLLISCKKEPKATLDITVKAPKESKADSIYAARFINKTIK